MGMQKLLEFLEFLRVPECSSGQGTLSFCGGGFCPPAKSSRTFFLRGTLRTGTLRSAAENEARNGLKFLKVPNAPTSAACCTGSPA
jgi:hypothetical protein